MSAVIGHRGAAGHAPENTLASIAKAAELGLGWVEFDTMLSRDDRVILFHSPRLERTTNGRGKVAEKDLAELQALDAGGWFGPSFLGEAIPTLRQALAELARLGLGAVVEIKPTRGRAEETGRIVAAVLQAEWPASLPMPVVSSYNAEALAAARSVAPELPRAFNMRRIERRWRRRLESLGCVALHCRHQYLTQRRTRAVRAAGYVVRCFTVNERRRAETLLRWGVGSIFTDFPERMAGLKRPEGSVTEPSI